MAGAGFDEQPGRVANVALCEGGEALALENRRHSFAGDLSREPFGDMLVFL